MLEVSDCEGWFYTPRNNPDEGAEKSPNFYSLMLFVLLTDIETPAEVVLKSTLPEVPRTALSFVDTAPEFIISK